MAWNIVANIKGPPGGGGTGSGTTEVWEGPAAPTPLADYLLWIDTDEPPPAPGTADKNYIHTQVGVSSSWAVTHNLGKFPSVNVVDSGGSMIIPDVLYIDLNHVTLSFGGATSGKAYFN